MAKVEEVMTKNISPVSPSTPILEVAQKMRDSGMGTIPVCKNGKLRGLISERSIVSRVVASGQNPKRECAGALMVNEGPKVSLGCDVVDAAKVMANHGIHCLPVVQNGGKFAGILMLSDLIKESMVLASMVLATSEIDSTQRAIKEKVPA